jgi:hypothetical protein
MQYYISFIILSQEYRLLLLLQSIFEYDSGVSVRLYWCVEYL